MIASDENLEKRLASENEDIILQKKSNKLPQEVIYFGPQTKNGTERSNEWLLKFRGREGTDLHPGVYQCRIEFPAQYPIAPPVVKFDHGFKHMHV